MKKIIISGGNGFLGSFLVEKALKENMDVTVVDDMSTSKEINVSKDVTFIKKKIEFFDTEENFDFIVHLAARPSPEDYIKHPIDTILSNSIGTKNMLELAKRSNGIFMYTSSSEVYGEASIIPTPETYYGYVNPNGIRSCYDESKRFSEALIMAYYREFGVDTRIQRPFNVFGPRMREDGEYGRVIPRFITQALNNENLTIFGNGKQTRSFLYIDDWVEATWKLLTKPNLAGTVINIGSNDEITINDLAELIKKLTNSKSRVVYEKERVDDPKRRAADLTKVKALIDWQPEISLEEGLKKTIRWFKERMK